MGAAHWAVCALIALAGCSSTMQHHTVYTATPCAPCGNVIFVADGAGNFQGLSKALRQAVPEAGLPMQVETVEWSHGLGRVLSDQMDFCHARTEGRRLAERIVAWKTACPDAQIVLLSHSAGAAVVLAAAENAPPNMIQEIVLLAPSISAEYDLRPALRNTVRGIDAFCSPTDVWALGIGAALVGTTDRRFTAPAGRVGFRPTVDCPEDAALLAKVRVHSWHPVVAWTGSHGGHDDSYSQNYLRAYVVPVLMP